MLLQTIVDDTFDGAKGYTGYCRAAATEDFQRIDLKLTETEYDDAFAETLSRNIADYCIHTVFTYDYESSSDAGDGRDDYYKEEEELQIDINNCIIKDNQFFGVMCECFDKQCFVLLDHPETVLYHPGNYGGRNYHFYRSKRFKLVKK